MVRSFFSTFFVMFSVMATCAVLFQNTWAGATVMEQVPTMEPPSATEHFQTEIYPAIPCSPTVAHRGNSAAAPENTFAALWSAVAVGADGCEFDLRATKDGEIILLHDATLNRTTNVPAELVDGKPVPVAADTLTLEEIRQLDAGSWKSKIFAGQRIPTFHEVLEYFREVNTPAPDETADTATKTTTEETTEGTKGSPAENTATKQRACTLVVELKDAGIEAAALREIHEAGMEEHCVIIAFSKDAVKTVRKLAPQIPVAWLWGGDWKGTEAELVEMLYAAAVELDTNLLDLEHGTLTEPVVRALRERGITVWAWTVDDPQRAGQLRSWGVESITTNRPDACREPSPDDQSPE